MITKNVIKDFIIKQGEYFPYIYNENEDAIYSKDGEYLCSMDDFVKTYRKNIGQSFEYIYSSELDLSTVLRCTECGTVIKSYEDESYEPHLCCPTCTGYKTSFKFWTKEEIDSNVDIQEEIKYLMKLSQRKKEMNERYIKRNNKYDWQIATKEFYGKKIFVGIYLDCDNITKSYLKGLELKLHFAKKSSNEIGYGNTKFIKIPLSWSKIYYRFIYPHLGKCHPDLRSKWYIGKPCELNDK